MEKIPPIKVLRRNQLIETQLEEFIERPHRRIRKLARASPDSDSADVKDLYNSLQRFGPFYNRDGSSLVSKHKRAMWQHVSTNSPADTVSTMKTYMSAMRKINMRARNTYEEDTVKNYLDDEFFWMMIEDGCFILQVVLYLLGGSEQLAYPPDHEVFGEKRNTKALLRTWTRSMFFVGNQIPQIVLMELMNQSFFQGVISKRKWERPCSDLFKATLYDSILLPALKTQRLRYDSCYPTFKEAIFKIFGYEREDGSTLQEPSDLLHALHLLVLGPKNGQNDDEDEDEEDDARDLECDGVDLECGSGIGSHIRSATELKQAGIEFKKISAGEGIRGIKFSTNIFRAVLELPVFVVDADTKWLLRYLIDYEITQELRQNRRQVGSYVQFLSDLILTPGDAKLLFKKGIIQADREQREKLPKLLKDLASGLGYSTQNVRIVRLKIEDYSRPPWEKIRNYLSVVLLLTLVQTIYTVLGYYQKK